MGEGKPVKLVIFAKNRQKVSCIGHILYLFLLIARGQRVFFKYNKTNYKKLFRRNFMDLTNFRQKWQQKRPIGGKNGKMGTDA